MLTQQAKHQPRKKISWPDLYFTAEANRETFQDVVVVTLKNFYLEEAYTRAIAEVGIKSEKRLTKRVYEIIEAQSIEVQEHVEVTHSGIRVVINRDTIDDNAVWGALDMLASALETLSGKSGAVPFGESMSFRLSELAWLRRH